MKKNIFMSVFIFLMAMLCLNGCGRKAEPFITKGEEDAFPRQYPDNEEE